MIPLFVARFQPLHKGHMHALKDIFRRYSGVVIAVGSTNKNDEENPFGFKERKAMLDAALKKYKGRYVIIGVRDVESDYRWSRAIEMKAKFDLVVTANTWTARCFHGYDIVKPTMLRPKAYNGTKIRNLIKQKREWENLVPEETIPIIKRL